MIWINGERQQQIAVSDRALHYGDGCFTTARLLQGKIAWLEAHLQRLEEAASVLMIYGVDWHLLKQEMLSAAASWQQAEGVLKVILSRGSGGRGYSGAGCQQPVRIIMLFAAPGHYAALRESGVRLTTSPVRLGINPQLAGIKHLNRLEQVLIRTQLEQSGADEALVLDTEGKLVECCAANLFWRKENQLFTPIISGAGVDGIMRRRIIALARRHGYVCQPVRAQPQTLADADEVFISNALMPLLPVRQIDSWHYQSRTLYQLLLPDC
ncbi:aminodeoxychorismate lyase [Mixta theicola]|uniref:Aminodeoxychorismate lyase n=1 Tax=Mixta theicola TaxID=1458355 RepID=A0A2K1QED0_9GAMM|nr:aminodeoxychorismate lyase [Mixta theicola]PNS13376.1 aminodeoxychorismate lyase [Mixta theicola]GLR09684.1 aminodeoxychorismate lyase [Mixta theicola]